MHSTMRGISQAPAPVKHVGPHCAWVARTRAGRPPPGVPRHRFPPPTAPARGLVWCRHRACRHRARCYLAPGGGAAWRLRREMQPAAVHVFQDGIHVQRAWGGETLLPIPLRPARATVEVGWAHVAEQAPGPGPGVPNCRVLQSAPDHVAVRRTLNATRVRPMGSNTTRFPAAGPQTWRCGKSHISRTRTQVQSLCGVRRARASPRAGSHVVRPCPPSAPISSSQRAAPPAQRTPAHPTGTCAMARHRSAAGHAKTRVAHGIAHGWSGRKKV